MIASRRLLSILILLLAGVAACTSGTSRKPSLDEQAEIAIAEGDTNQAKKLLRSAVGKHHEPRSYMRLGELYREENSIKARVQSQRLLTDGLRRYPDHPGLILELGKTYYRQTFYGDAQRCFERVLELIPGHCIAHYYLGLNWFRKWHHIQQYEQHLRTSRAHMRRVIECDPSNENAFYLFAFSHHALGDLAALVQTCKQFIQTHPENYRPYSLLAAVAFEDERYEDADALFESAMSLISKEERENHASVALLLPDDEATEYERDEPSKRLELRRAFWAERDPDLTTPMNERQIEHLYRMFLADAYFYNAKPALRGWETERGRALVKFGWPMATRSTLQGHFTDGRMEIWLYEEGFAFFFRDEFLNGNYIIPMDNRYAWAAQTLYQEEPTTEIISNAVAIPGVIDLISFRNTDYSSEVYVAVKVDIDSLHKQIELDRADRFVARTAFYTQAWQPFFFESDTLSSRAFTDEQRRGRRWLHVVTSYELPFDFHRVAFCLEDQWAASKSQLLSEISTLGYFADTLVASDILFYSNRADAASHATIRRGGREFFPNPGGSYRLDEKLRLYLEIYNLNLERSQSKYDITYSIFEARERGGAWSAVVRGIKWVAGLSSDPEPVISQTLHRTGRSHDADEALAVDIEALEPGDYILQINIRDTVGERAVERRKGFTREPARSRGQGR
jgi:GWxTD domain-containing protein